MDVQNETTSPLGSGYSGGIAGQYECGEVGVPSDDPSREDALKKHDNHKMDPALQAARAHANTKRDGSGRGAGGGRIIARCWSWEVVVGVVVVKRWRT